MGVSTGITWPGYGTMLCICKVCGHQRELASERFKEQINDMGYHHGGPPDNVRRIRE